MADWPSRSSSHRPTRLVDAGREARQRKKRRRSAQQVHAELRLYARYVNEERLTCAALHQPLFFTNRSLPLTAQSLSFPLSRESTDAATFSGRLRRRGEVFLPRRRRGGGRRPEGVYADIMPRLDAGREARQHKKRRRNAQQGQAELRVCARYINGEQRQRREAGYRCVEVPFDLTPRADRSCRSVYSPLVLASSSHFLYEE